MSKVAVALSGGVDSAVTAALLKQQGHEVIGITGKMTEDSEQIVLNAQKVAEKLQIPHYVIDATKGFREKIINYFETSYQTGKTPNPCIMCNKFIKWGLLFDYATEKIGADFIATGHYANIIESEGCCKLYPASDEHKDQLYFLFMLEQEKLKKTMFPLSKYKKSEVKQLAKKYDLPPKSSKESQDICFIKAPMTTKKYLNNLLGTKRGDFIEKTTGKILGHHEGFWQYTIGQRKGIGIAAPEPLYVTGIDPASNIVYVGKKNELFIDALKLQEIFWSYHQPNKKFAALVKVRYNMKPVKAIVNGLNISFIEQVTAPAEGQACVLYDVNDGHLLGGGFI